MFYVSGIGGAGSSRSGHRSSLAFAGEDIVDRKGTIGVDSGRLLSWDRAEQLETHLDGRQFARDSCLVAEGQATVIGASV